MSTYLEGYMVFIQTRMLLLLIIMADILLSNVSYANVTEQKLQEDLHLHMQDMSEFKLIQMISNDNNNILYRNHEHSLRHKNKYNYIQKSFERNHESESKNNKYRKLNIYDKVETTMNSPYRLTSIQNWVDNSKRNLNENDSNVNLGWVPSSYPDPIKNPDICRIPDSYQNWRDDQGNMGDSNIGTTFFNEHLLLMCDPDGIISDEDLKQVGSALIDFNSRYARSTNGCDDYRNEYKVGVAQDWKPPSKLSNHRNLLFLSNSKERDESNTKIEIGIALARKIDINAILNEFRFYTFEDEESMTDDAAQFFASILHSQWFNDDRNNVGPETQGRDCVGNIKASSGILIFLSVEDRVCFISSGNSISYVLPWWRLEHVVTNMKEKLRTQRFSDAIIGAISDISQMIEIGPPTFSEKLNDFSARFGLVFLFSLFTFSIAIYGEIRERQRRFEYAEISTSLNEREEEKAKILQENYQTDCCPICLEDFTSEGKEANKEVDSHGIPLKGSDGKPMKMLRCGHIFCLSCWREWAHSGNGNPFICPVCRQDVSRSAATQINARETRESFHPLLEADESQLYGAVEPHWRSEMYPDAPIV